MRFELSQRVNTRASEEELLGALLRQFKKVSAEAKRHHHQIIARKIENTIGAPFRTTKAAVTAKPMEDGYLLVADVSYTPSLGFFLAVLCGLFTFVLWLIPVVFYLTQKGSVRTTIEKAMLRVRDEYESTSVSARPVASGVASELESLHRLKAGGVLTAEEFEAQKRRLLSASAA